MRERSTGRGSIAARAGGALRARPWAWYPALVAAVAALYLAGPLGAGPVFNALGASSAVAIVIGARLHRPRARWGWDLIALGQVAFVVGDVLAYNYDSLFGGPLPFPSIADPFYLALYPCLAVGLLVLLRANGPARDRGALIDALVVTIGVGTLSWVFLMAPYAHDGSLALATKLTSLAYPLMDLLLLAVGVRAALSGARRGAGLHLMLAALVTLLVTDAIYGWLQLHGGYDTGGLLDAGWIAFYALLGTAALHPSMRRLSERTPHRHQRLTPRRLALFAFTSLVAPLVQLVRALADAPREPVVSVAAGLLFLLVLARLAGMVRAQEAETESMLRRRFEQRLAALVRHSSDVVTLLDAQGRITYVSPSGARLLGRATGDIAGRRWDAFVHPDDVAALRSFLASLVPGEPAARDYRVVGGDGAHVDVETLATNLLGDDTVGAIVLNTRDVTERRALERRLAHQASHDALTALPGRALLLDRMERALARRRRERCRVGALFVDLDDFKAINDRLGHAGGDAALREVAARLEQCVRVSDSVARFHGDEFVVLLDGIEDAGEATAVAERVVEALRRPLALGEERIDLSASVGVAVDDGDADTAEQLVRRADAAMYVAKGAGKGRYAVSGEAPQPRSMSSIR